VDVHHVQDCCATDGVEGVGKVQLDNAGFTGGRVQKAPNALDCGFGATPDAQPVLNGGKQFLRGRARRFGDKSVEGENMAIGRSPPSFLRKAIKLAPKKRC